VGKNALGPKIGPHGSSNLHDRLCKTEVNYIFFKIDGLLCL